MRVLYLDCGMGAAGDMLTAALSELFAGDTAQKILDLLNIPNVSFQLEKTEKCGIVGTRAKVTVGGVEEGDCHDHHHEHDHCHGDHEHDHHHEHHGMDDITTVVNGLALTESIKADVLSVYKIIADAESKVHGEPVEKIHFHEVGAMDAVADVTAVSALISALNVDKVIVSPINLGSGTVICAHGTLPVPAPATAEIIKDMPCYGSEIKGELLTPTGAALIKHFADGFGNMPAMKVFSVGYGMGKKDFERANCVRAILGETVEDGKDTVVELCFNVDDMTAEEIAFACEKLLSAGAKEVFTSPAYMKKGRLGTLVTVLIDQNDENAMTALIFKHTSTIGVRKKICERSVLDRKTIVVDTPEGKVRKKTSYGYGVTKSKYEYDDVSRLADKLDLSLDEAVKYVEKFDK